MQCGLHSEMLAPWMFLSWVSNPSSLRGGALGPPLLIGRKTALESFSQNLGFHEISARAVWHHHHFYNTTSHAGHSGGWWRAAGALRTFRSFCGQVLVLTITCLYSWKCQIPPRSVARVTGVWMYLHHRSPLAHAYLSGHMEGLMQLCSFWKGPIPAPAGGCSCD